MSDGGHGYTFTLGNVTYRIHTVCGDGQLTRVVITVQANGGEAK